MHRDNKERRMDVRYSINAPASLTLENSTAFACMLFLHDISSGGALVSSIISLPKNVAVILRTRLPFQEKLFGRDEVELILRGKVIREEKETGQFAIKFDDDYRIKASLPD